MKKYVSYTFASEDRILVTALSVEKDLLKAGYNLDGATREEMVELVEVHGIRSCYISTLNGEMVTIFIKR